MLINLDIAQKEYIPIKLTDTICNPNNKKTYNS